MTRDQDGKVYLQNPDTVEDMGEQESAEFMEVEEAPERAYYAARAFAPRPLHHLSVFEYRLYTKTEMG